DDLHTVVRLTYPWKFGNGQFFETSIQAYSGKYVPSTGNYRGPGDIASTPALMPAAYRNGYDDERVGVSAIWYPQPFGVQAEWNWGRTPALDLATNTIGEENLIGGYVQAMLNLDNAYGTFLPFVKW